MKRKKSEEDSVKKKTEEMQAELNEKIQELEYLHSLNTSLTSKHFEINTELQNARKLLIEGLRNKLNASTKIGIRMMGVLDAKPFQAVCKKKFSSEEADLKAALLCSKWEERLKNPNWHPFEVSTVNDKEMEIIKEDDEKLSALREQWGVDVYEAVKKALLELNEYNPSGRYIVAEFWNNKENKKASFCEVIDYIIQRINRSGKRTRS